MLEYMGNKEYWDERFKQRNDKLLSPEGVLIDNINCFKKGSVLDIACGDGRNALFFLENGFEITGVDFSLNALERLKIFAEKSNYSIETRQIDLSKPSGLKDIGIFDNIVINHYRLSRENLVDIENHISDDGILFISGFGYKHKVDERIRKQDLIQPMDIEMLKKSFQFIKYIEDDSKRGFLVTYILKKKISKF